MSKENILELGKQEGDPLSAYRTFVQQMEIWGEFVKDKTQDFPDDPNTGAIASFNRGSMNTVFFRDILPHQKGAIRELDSIIYSSSQKQEGLLKTLQEDQNKQKRVIGKIKRAIEESETEDRESLREAVHPIVKEFQGLCDGLYSRYIEKPQTEKILEDLQSEGLDEMTEKKGYSLEKVHELIKGAENAPHLIAILGEIGFRDRLGTKYGVNEEAHKVLKPILDQLPGKDLSTEHIKKEFNSVGKSGDSYKSFKAPIYSEKVREVLNA